MEETREFHLDEISVRSICIDVLKNIWLIVLSAAAAWFAVTGAEKWIYVPEYTATATLVVNATGNTNAYSSLVLTNQMASVFSEVFQSNVLRDRIAEDLGMDSVEGEISTSVIEETNLIILRVTSVNPRQTYLMIQSALDNYDTVSDYLFSNAVLRILQEPTVPVSPSNVLDLGRIRKIGMLGAAAAITAAVILFSVLRFTIKTKEGAKRNLDGKILGIVPYVRKRKTWKETMHRKNRSLLISSPLVSMIFSESVRKVVTRLDHHIKRRNQKVIMVTSVLENEGKSTVAANLALALAEKEKRVVLLDGDFKKPAQYKIFSRPQTNNVWMIDYLTGKAPMNEVFAYDKNTNLFTVYQNSGVRNSSGLLGSDNMRTLVETCRENMDYVILDSPPMALSSDAELMMRMVDAVVLVVCQDRADIRAINDAADTIRQNKVDFAGFVLNAFHKDVAFEHSREYGKYYRHAEKEEVSEG